MDFSTYMSQLVFDPVLQRGVPGVAGRVVDMATGEQVATYKMDGTPGPAITNRSGYVQPFKVAGLVTQIEVTFGQITLPMISFESVLGAAAAADESAVAAGASALSAWEAANLVEAPSDTAVATLVKAIGSLTRAELDLLFGSLATIVKAGLMPPEDKAKLDGAAFAATPNTIPLRNASGNTRMNELWLDKAPSAVDSAVRRSYVDDIVTVLNAGIAGRALAAHSHTQIAAAAGHLLRVSASGYIDHVVAEATVWSVSPAGVLGSGSVPWARITGNVPWNRVEPTASLVSGGDLNTYLTRGKWHANNAVASASTNYPVPYAGLLEVETSETGTMVYQRYSVYATASASTKGKIYSRSFYSGTWTAWETPLIGKGIYAVRVSITPTAADTPTALNVTYPVGHFTVAPIVQVTPYTTVAGTTVTGWGVDGETVNGCTAWVTRKNTSGTGLNITATGT